MKCKRSSSRISAGVVIGNDDLLMQILLFLSPISLIRFQLVSKHWYSLISAPSFRHRHTLRHRPEPSFLIRNCRKSDDQFFICNPTIKKFTPFNLLEFAHMKIMQSCNGLLLLEGRNPGDYNEKSYLIYNPTTRQHRSLFMKRPCAGIFLAFDPMKSPHYKVICCRRDQARVGSKYRFSIDVYESETHTWKYNCGELLNNVLRLCNGIYWNDGLYFITPFGKYSYCLSVPAVFEGDVVVQCIDKPPRGRTQGKRRGYSMESNGHFYLVRLSMQPHKNSLSVAELNKDYHTWFVKYRIDLSPIAALFGEEYHLVNGVLGIVRGDKEEDTVFVFHASGKIIFYRFYDECFEVVIDFTREDYYFEDFYQFIETLALV